MAKRSEDRVGQQFGNYRLMALLGQGGFAEVYLVQHVRLNLQGWTELRWSSDGAIRSF